MTKPDNKSKGPDGEVLRRGLTYESHRKLPWIARWREGSKHRSKAFRGDRKREAERFLEDQDERDARGRSYTAPTDTPFLKDYARDWMRRWARGEIKGRKKIKGSPKDKTIKDNAWYLDSELLPGLGHLRIGELDRRTIAGWRDGRMDAKGGKGGSCVKRSLALLSFMLDTAVEDYEYLEDNPAARVGKPDGESKPREHLTAEQIEALRLWFLDRGDLHSATMISVGGYVGPRPGEIDALRWVDLRDGKRFLVNKRCADGLILPGNKTDDSHEREVSIPDPVQGDLERWREASPFDGPRDLIFPREDGQPKREYDYNNWAGRCFKKAVLAVCASDAEIPDHGLDLRPMKPEASPYWLRGSAATLYCAAGWGAPEVANQLGNTAREVMTRYAKNLIVDGSQPRIPIDDFILRARGIAPVQGRGERQEAS